MNRYRTTEPDDEDARLNESLSEPDRDPASFASSDEMRLARIEEYQDESLRKEDSLAACVGGLNGGLMRIAVRCEQALVKAIETAPDGILEMPVIQRAMGTYLGLTRQVERLANFEASLSESRRQAEDAKSQRRLGAGQRPVAGFKRSR